MAQHQAQSLRELLAKLLGLSFRFNLAECPLDFSKIKVGVSYREGVSVF
jgi:hypothetical protein